MFPALRSAPDGHQDLNDFPGNSCLLSKNVLEMCFLIMGLWNILGSPGNGSCASTKKERARMNFLDQEDSLTDSP
jgi:hypothetical protein